VKPSDPDRRQIWEQRHAEAEGLGQVCAVLQRNAHLLPKRGRALDLACGRGANALELARLGLQVEAWDFSVNAIERLERAALERGLSVSVQVRDVVERPPAPDRYDVVLVSYFLDRQLAPAIAEALRPGGLLFYETFAQEAVGSLGPGNPDFRLSPGELLRLFPGLQPRVFRDEGRVGDLAQGLRDVSLFVGERLP
jgi:2-polyprenyl-3-methyl-5-hydroxy-6-metoxy-1,4-benzoquinol methylase